MVQPKDPPLSVRLPKPLRERVEAWAAERGIKRNAAVVQLIERGLVPKPIETCPNRTPKPAKPAAKAEPSPKAEFKSRLKGQWKAP